MLKYENGQYIEMTQEEINEQKQLFEMLERNRPQTVEEQILELQSVLISQKISGGGITITDSSTLPIKDFAMQGKTEQFTTTGAQLFDVDAFLNLDLEDVMTFGKGRQTILTLEPNTKYTMSTDAIGNVNSSTPEKDRSLYFTTIDDTTLNGMNTAVINGTPRTVVSDDKGQVKVILLDRDNSIPIVKKEKYVMLNQGETPLPYEQYTGGKPSPSVEYPQEIINAGDGGSVEIKVTGKNLFDISKLKIEHDDEKIVVKQSDIYGITLVRNFKENTRYTVSFESHKNDGGSNYVLFEFVYTDGSKSEWYANGIPKKGFTSVANKTIDYLWIRNPWKAYAEITKIQVEKGIERTEYEVYKEPQVLTIPLDRPMTKWDRLEKRDGVYGIVCKSKEVVFDGSGDEIWRNQTDLIGNTQFYITLDDSSIKNTPDFIDNFYCDKFTKTSKTGDIAIGEVRYGILKYTFAPVFKPKDEVNTLSLWRNLLKENTIKVTYITDAEEFVPLPEETQIALNALHTYYPTTVMSNSENCEMEVEYICDTKNYVDKKIQGIVTKQIETNNLILERTM